MTPLEQLHIWSLEQEIPEYLCVPDYENILDQTSWNGALAILRFKLHSMPEWGKVERSLSELSLQSFAQQAGRFNQQNGHCQCGICNPTPRNASFVDVITCRWL